MWLFDVSVFETQLFLSWFSASSILYEYQYAEIMIFF